jgi:ribosomal protein S27AE
MFEPEKCPKCGKTTVVEHYDTGWRVVCPCGYYGVFHFDTKKMRKNEPKNGREVKMASAEPKTHVFRKPCGC